MSRKPKLPARESIRGGTSQQLEHKIVELEGKLNSLEQENKTLKTGVLGSLSTSEIKACSVFLNHENRYVNHHLRACHDFYLKPLKVYLTRGQAIMSQEDINIIFRNFDNIYLVHQQLYKDMIQTAISTPLGLPKEIGQFMNQFVPYFKLYITFLDQRDEAMSRLKELYKDQRFVNWHEIQEPCAGQSLRHFLERPTKRLQEYLGDLMKAYASFADKDCQSAKNLIQTAQNLKETLDRIAHNLKVSRGRKNLIALSNRYGLTALQTNSRWVVVKSEAQSLFNHRWKDIEFVICNDMVFTAKEAGFVFGGLKWALSFKGLILFDTLNENKKENQELMKFVKKYNTGHCFYLRNWEVDSDTYVVAFQAQKTRDACYTELMERIEEHQMSQRQCNPHGLEKRLRGKKTNAKEKDEYVIVDIQSASSANLLSNNVPAAVSTPPPFAPSVAKQRWNNQQDSELNEAAEIPLPTEPPLPPYKRAAPSPPTKPRPAPPVKPRSAPPAKPSNSPPKAPQTKNLKSVPSRRPNAKPSGGPPAAPHQKKKKKWPPEPEETTPSWVKSSSAAKKTPPPKRPSNRFAKPPPSRPEPPKKTPAVAKRPPAPRQNVGAPPANLVSAPPPFKQKPPPQPSPVTQPSEPEPSKRSSPARPNFLKDLGGKKNQLKKVEPRAQSKPQQPSMQNDLAALIEASRRGYRETVGVSDSEGSDSDWD